MTADREAKHRRLRYRGHAGFASRMPCRDRDLSRARCRTDPRSALSQAVTVRSTTGQSITVPCRSE